MNGDSFNTESKSKDKIDRKLFLCLTLCDLYLLIISSGRYY